MQGRMTMSEFKTEGMIDYAQSTLSQLIAEEKFNEALQFYIENKTYIPAWRRRFYFACINDGLTGHNAYRRVIRTAIIMVAVNLLLEPLFSLRLLDIFSFVSRKFIYYNYYAALLPSILNVFFVAGLLMQWRTWVALPGKLFKRKIKPKFRAAFYGICAVVIAYTAFTAAPFVKDYGAVRGGEYLTYSISEADHIAMVYGELIRTTTDRPDVVASLRKELHDKYGWALDADNYPTPYYHSAKGLFGRNENYYFIAPQGAYFKASDLQMKAYMYNTNVYPYVIEYLPNCKIILQITN